MTSVCDFIMKNVDINFSAYDEFLKRRYQLQCVR